MVTVGLDEVGRGCWAGPLVAGAVALPPDLDLSSSGIKLRDSKKLSKSQRTIAAQWIHDKALAIGLGWVAPGEIDEVGLSKAVRLAMTRAFEQIQVAYDEIVIDGNINYLANYKESRAIIKADDTVLAVSAASIVAKVARDDYMAKADEQYVGYGFKAHVGYGTAAHIAALRELGVSDLHRRSYKPIQAFLTAAAETT